MACPKPFQELLLAARPVLHDSRFAEDIETRTARMVHALAAAERTLADVEAQPHPAETAERWRRAHGEAVRCRLEVHAMEHEALMLRHELERQAHRARVQARTGARP